MKEKFEFEPKKMDAIGHCKVEYKDPITGKVLEKIEGDNHVFIDQFYVKDLRSLLSCDLVLTNGESTLDTTIPMIPGAPIGYGRIDSTASGWFRGAYRATDSYIYRGNSEKIESNYVYDFLSTQIPDTIRYVGLRPHYDRQPNFILDKNVDWWLNGPKIINVEEHFQTLFQIQQNGSTTWFSSDGECSTTPTGLRMYFSDPFNNSSSIKYITNLILPDINSTTDNFSISGTNYSFASNHYAFNYAYDNNNKNFIIRCLQVKAGSASGSARGAIIKTYYWVINKNLDTLISKNTLPDKYFTNSSGSYQYTYTYDTFVNTTFSACCPLAQSSTGDYMPYRNRSIGNFISSNGNNFCCFDYKNSSLSRTNNLYIIEENMETGEITRTQLPYSAADDYYMQYATSKDLYIYKNYIWPGLFMRTASGEYDISSILKVNQFRITPVYNLNTNTIYSYTQDYTYNSGRTNKNYIQKGVGSQFPNVWVVGYRDSDSDYYTLNMPFALSAYRLPLDAPTRPSGAAVTVTYNLQIFY